MKISFEDQGFGGAQAASLEEFSVSCETDLLTDVLLCPPRYLSAVPCCSVTRESLRGGFRSSTTIAQQQHELLRQTLEANGVRCHIMTADPELPDACFTRDSMAATPWGIASLRPAMPHRAIEAAQAAKFIRDQSRVRISHVGEGVIEGGDICVARPGLLIVGISGDRTDETGARSFAEPFKTAGWEVVTYHLDPHFLHLDTIFCMIDENRALACTEVLDDGFLESMSARGIDLLPVTYKEARKLGCNILSLDGRTVIASAGTPRVSALMREIGIDVIELPIEQFAACGGGIHCLTMPLRRQSKLI